MPKVDNFKDTIKDASTTLLACGIRNHCWDDPSGRREPKFGNSSSEKKNGFNNMGCTFSHAVLDQFTGIILTGSNPHWKFTIRANRTQLDSSQSFGTSGFG